MIEDREDVAFLDLLAAAHHQHAVGDFGNHAHVVGDEDQRHAELALQAAHEPQHLRLNGDVECGRRLVCNQQARAAGQRHRDHDPLPHAAGELERIAVELPRRFRNTHALQHPLRLRAGGGVVLALVEDDGLGDLVAHA